MKDLEKEYGKKFIDFVIKVDELTEKEIKDVEYLEERIETHLEELSKLAFEDLYRFTKWKKVIGSEKNQ